MSKKISLKEEEYRKETRKREGHRCPRTGSTFRTTLEWDGSRKGVCKNYSDESGGKPNQKEARGGQYYIVQGPATSTSGGARRNRKRWTEASG